METQLAVNKPTFETKEKLYNILSEVIEKASGDKGEAELIRIENGLTRFTALQWNRTATKAIKAAVGSFDTRSSNPVSKTDVRRILMHLDREFHQLQKKIEARTKKDIEKLFKKSKKIFRDRFEVKPNEKSVFFDQRKIQVGSIEKLVASPILKQGEDLADLVFTSTDQATVANISRLHLIAAGEHFSNNHKATISNLINEGVFQRGMPKRQAGEFLRDELSKRLGGLDRAVPEALRRQGQRSANAYFEGLSVTSVTRARNFGNINLMDEVGVLQVVWASIIDNRTSEICLDMNGRVFTLEMVKAQQRAILDEETSEGIKEKFGWRKNLSEFGLRAGERLSSIEAAQLLADSGVPIVPPAHFRCRSELQPA